MEAKRLVEVAEVVVALVERRLGKVESLMVEVAVRLPKLPTVPNKLYEKRLVEVAEVVVALAEIRLGRKESRMEEATERAPDEVMPPPVIVRPLEEESPAVSMPPENVEEPVPVMVRTPEEVREPPVKVRPFEEERPAVDSPPVMDDVAVEVEVK